jgi:hypothetical protein
LSTVEAVSTAVAFFCVEQLESEKRRGKRVERRGKR